MKYKAYISASGSELAQQHCQLLSQELEKYGGRGSKIWTSHISIPGGAANTSALPAEIQSRLLAAEHFVFLAEANIARSATCLLELEYWCKMLGRSDQLIIVLIDGKIELDLLHEQIDWTKTNALPPLLENITLSIPLFLDLQFVQEYLLEHVDLFERYRNAIIPLRAKLEKRTPEELSGKEYQRYLRNKKWRTWLLVLLTLLMIGSVFFFLHARKMRLRADMNLELTAEKAEEAQRALIAARQHSQAIKRNKDLAFQSSKEAQWQQQLVEYNSSLSQRNLSHFKESLRDFLMIKAWENVEDDSRLAYLLMEEAVKLNPDIGQDIKDTIADYFSLNYQSPNQPIDSGLDTLKRLSSDKAKFAFLVQDLASQQKLKVWNFLRDTILNFGPIHQDEFFFDQASKRIFFISEYEASNQHFSWNYWDFQSQHLTSFKNCLHFGHLDQPMMSNVFSHDEQKMAFLSDYQVETQQVVLNIWDFKQRKLHQKIVQGLPIEGWPQYLLRFTDDGKQMVFLTHSDENDRADQLHIWDFQQNQTDIFSNAGASDASLRDLFFGKEALISPTDYDVNANTTKLIVWDKGKHYPLPFSGIFPEEFSLSPDRQKVAFFSHYSETDQNIRMSIYDLKTKKKISFDNIYYPDEYFWGPSSSISDRYEFVLNGRQLTYFTKGKHGHLELNIYDFERTKTKKISGLQMTFPAGYDPYSFSSQSHLVPDYKYNQQKTQIVFWTDGPGESKLFNKWDFELLQLQTDTVISSYTDVNNTELHLLDTLNGTFFWQSKTGFNSGKMEFHQLNTLDQKFLERYRDSCNLGPFFAYQYNYIVYWTECDRYNGTLNVYDIKRDSLILSVENSYPYQYKFARQGNALFLFTNDQNGPGGNTLILYNLEKATFNRYPVAGRPRYSLSQDEEKLAILQEEERIVTIIELESGNVLRQIKHRNSIYRYQFLNGGNLLLTQSRASHSKHQILKFSPLIDEQKLFPYYADRFAPLTKEERLRFGLLGLENQ